MICPRCGQEMATETKFCPRCGQFITEQALVNVSPIYRPIIAKKIPQENILAGVLCILGLLGSIFIPLIGILLCAIGYSLSMNSNYKTGKILGIAGLSSSVLLLILANIVTPPV